jgi:transcriptional regulator with XRE-family HTH domain
MGSRARQTDFDDDDRLIAATMRALTGATNMSQNEVAEHIGMNKSTYSRRLHAGFLASDVKRLALLFGVPVGEIYDGLGGSVKVRGSDGGRPPRRATTGGYVHAGWGLAA